MKPINARLVVSDRGWIIEKFMVRLAENLTQFGVNAEVSSKVSANADVHHLFYFDPKFRELNKVARSRTTFFVTHIDRVTKLFILKQRMKQAGIAICMSRMTVEDMVRKGIEREKLCYILAGHDGRMVPRRLVLGIASSLSDSDAMVREMIRSVAQTTRLAGFHFEIAGSGWTSLVGCLEQAGASVHYEDRADQTKFNTERIPRLDYYLDFGMENGFLAFLNALAAGVPVIAKPQGCNLDIEGSLAHSFTNAAELAGILSAISQERKRRVDAMTELTWAEYARQHAIAWRALLEGRRGEVTHLLHANSKLPPLDVQLPKPRLADKIRFLGLSTWDSIRSDARLWAWEYAPLSTIRLIRRLKRLGR